VSNENVTASAPVHQLVGRFYVNHKELHKIEKYMSLAEWPDDVFTASDGSHISADEHNTREEASSVASMLMRYGFGGFGKRPLRVWVESFEVSPNSTMDRQPPSACSDGERPNQDDLCQP
jgi:hypothetical protein